MKPRPFKYFAPSCVADAVQVLSEQDDEARVLAGGQSLVPLMNMRFAAPSALVDLNRCSDLAYLRVEEDRVVLGAMVRQADAECSGLVLEQCPLVGQALQLNGHPAIRHRGTVGGTLAHADPVAELPGAAVALGAEMVIAGPSGRRSVAAEDFFLGPLTTCIEPGEILIEVRFPLFAQGAKSSFVESGIRQHDLAIAGIAAYLETDDDNEITGARMAAIGVGPCPVRLRMLENVLTAGRLDSSATAEAVEADLADVDVMENLHATARYRRRLAAVLARRAVQDALAHEGRQ